MKTILFLLTALLLVSTSINAQKQTDAERKGLKGRVKSVEYADYTAVEKFGEIEKGSLDYIYTHKYDNNGNEIEWCKYYSDGSLEQKDTYKYDNKGNIIEACRYKSDGSLERKDTKKYDNNGNEIEWCIYESDGSLERKDTHKYDNNGNEIEWCRYKSDGSLDYKYTFKYKYDSKNSWIERVSYHNDKPYEIIERIIEYH